MLLTIFVLVIWKLYACEIKKNICNWNKNMIVLRCCCLLLFLLLLLSELFNLSYNLCCYVTGLNVLAGVGLLSTPYAMKEAGWISLAALLVLGAVCCYTASLMRYCFEIRKGIYTFPDMGEAAFGKYGRIFVAVSLFFSYSQQQLYPSKFFLCSPTENMSLSQSYFYCLAFSHFILNHARLVLDIFY